MSTQNTKLCLVNFSGKKIKKMTSVVANPNDWDGDSLPDINFNINNSPMPDLDSKCEREEIVLGTSDGCWFSLSIEFEGENSTLSFKINQLDAKKKLFGLYSDSLKKSADNNYLEVFRATGEDRYTYSNSFYIRPSTVPNNSRWMGEVLAFNYAVKLNDLTMPGSHDAGMYTDITEKARTQALNIYDQLKAGSRYFDLRICKSSGELWTYHGASYGGKLQDILNDVKTFLTENSSEAVFLKFRSYASSDQQDTTELVKNTLGGLLYKNSTTPNFANQPLINFSGKAVAVFKSYDASLLDPANGIFEYSDYGNEDTGKIIPYTDNHNFGVYDSYAHRSEFDIMQKDQQQKWIDYGGYNKEYLFLFSWTLTGSTDNILDLELLSRMANPQLANQLRQFSKNQKGSPNIVYLDYIDNYLGQAIIHLNPALNESTFARNASVGGKNNYLWAISTKARNGGYAPMFREASGEWVTVDAPAAITKLSVGPDGNAYAINSGGQIWELDRIQESSATYIPYSGIVKDISIGAKGALWAISSEARAGGFAPIFRDENNQWITVKAPSAVTKLSAAPDGSAYAINSSGQIWRIERTQENNATYIAYAGVVKDVAVGADGTVWAISDEARLGGFVPMFLDSNKQWVKVDAPAAGLWVSVGNDGTAYIVNDDGNIWSLNKRKEGGGTLLSPT